MNVAPTTRLKALLREPLVQFLLLGGALFALHALWRPPGAAPSGEIVVNEARLQNLAQTFRRTWQRPPTRAELDGLIDDHVREEVLVREALALGLDRDDPIIRRRLRQKLEFLSDETTARRAPTDRELEDYLRTHPQAFRRDPRISFEQVFLDPTRRGAALPAQAKELLARLNRPAPANRPGVPPADLGDSLLLLDPKLENASKEDVAALFGTEFADDLLSRKPGPWLGPIASGYGVHLVRITAITPGELPPLAEVRPQVEREWQSAQRREQGEALYRQLLGKYSVKRPAPAPKAAKASGADEARP